MNENAPILITVLESIVMMAAGILFWVFVIRAIKKAAKNSSVQVDKKRPIYHYARKSFLMTRNEFEFMKKLENVIQGEYYIFPQIHLSAFISHKVEGQSWKHAFGHINGKSVDFILCDKTHGGPILAIEVDDWSHSLAERQERDMEVERILQEAGVALLRIKDNKELNEDDLRVRLRLIIPSSSQSISQKVFAPM